MKYLLSIIFLFSAHILVGQLHQVFLQIEEVGNEKPIRLVPGDKFSFKTIDLPDVWQRRRIIEIMPEKSIVILDEGYIKPNQILSYRYKNIPMTVFGGTMLSFGTTWFVYGGLAADIDKQDVIIGTTSLALGSLFSFVLNKKKIRFGKKNRLRIMDIRMNVP